MPRPRRPRLPPHRLPRTSKIRDLILSTTTYHLLHSFTPDEAAKYAWTGARNALYDFPLERGALGGLGARAAMPNDDYRTHDDTVPAVCYTYNARLNFADITRHLFQGFAAETTKTYTYPDQPSAFQSGIINADIYYEINENGQNLIVRQTASAGDSHATLGDGHDHSADTRFSIDLADALPSLIFYPSLFATRAVLHLRTTRDGVTHESLTVHSLTRHPHLNAAQCLTDAHTPQTDAQRREAQDIIDRYNAQTEQPATSIPNALMQSAAGNPFFFPVSLQTTVSSSRILALCSAARAISDGQFGQFPLHAFTEEGIYALSVSGDGAYLATQPVSRDVIASRHSVCPLDGGIAFATAHDIRLLQGEQTKRISADIDSPTAFTIPAPASPSLPNALLTSDGNGLVRPATFPDILPTARLLYDYRGARIIVHHRDTALAYVYHITTARWTTISANIQDTLNAYPDAFTLSRSGQVLDYAHPSPYFPYHLYIVTRPITLGAPDTLKSIHTAIVRGAFYGPNLHTYIEASDDLRHWHRIASSSDHRLRHVHAAPHRYFRLIIQDLRLDTEESIHTAEIEAEARFNARLR